MSGLITSWPASPPRTFMNTFHVTFCHACICKDLASYPGSRWAGPSHNFSPRLRDKIWEAPGDEAILTVLLRCSTQLPLRAELIHTLLILIHGLLADMSPALNRSSLRYSALNVEMLPKYAIE